MNFLEVLGAYCLGWLMCNILVGQIAYRVDSKWRAKDRAQFAAEVAEAVMVKMYGKEPDHDA